MSLIRTTLIIAVQGRNVQLGVFHNAVILLTTLQAPLGRRNIEQQQQFITVGKKGKVFPYSLPSVGPGADPGVQAVSPQVT